MRVDAKIQAREWILSAIQNHSDIPTKETEREIRKFVERLQRDVRQMNRSRELYVLVNSPDPEARVAAMKLIHEDLPPRGKNRKREVKMRQREISRLIKDQKKDARNRKIRFEHAIDKPEVLK